MSIRRLTSLALLATVTSLAACGGDGETDRDVLTKILKDGGRDPTTICAHLSDQLLKRFGTIERCRKAARSDPKNTDRAVRIRKLTIDGDKATAKITDNRGDATLMFVKDHGSWKVLDTK